MGLHIEINAPLTRDEWTAVAAVAAIMLGETALTSGTVSAPALAEAGLGIDADRPPLVLSLEEANAALATAGAPPPPPPPPVSASEALMATEAARVEPAAVVPPPPPAQAPPAGVELDKNGLPWDLRIHAATKAKNGDGSWRNKRGVDKSLLEQVTAELRLIMAAPVPPVAVDAAPATLDPAAAFGDAAPAPLPVASPGVPPPPPAEPAVDPAAGAPPEFARIMQVVVAKQAAKTLSTAQTTAIAAQIGLTSVRDLAARPDLIPAFEALLPK